MGLLLPYFIQKKGAKAMKIRFDNNFKYEDSQKLDRSIIEEFSRECITKYPDEFQFNGDEQAFFDLQLGITVIIQKIAEDEYLIREYYPLSAVIDVQ